MKFTTGDLRTRQRLLEAAVWLLGNKGLTKDLLAETIALADCPDATARIYFQRDEDLILALYARLASDLEARVPELPEGSVAERFKFIMLAKLELVAPYREALTALLATLLDPRHKLGVLNEQTEIIRSRVMAIFSTVVLGAKDKTAVAPDQLVRALYTSHLALMLLWAQDQTANAASAAIDLVGELLSLLSRSSAMAWLPSVKLALGKIDQVCGALIEAEVDGSNTKVAPEVLRRLFRHRRLLPGAGDCADRPCEQCLALHLPRVRHAVAADEPIHFLLPSFPAKSPSERKVLGAAPDMAEELALAFLEQVCHEIAEIYPPGARITICSDGRVFSDLVDVDDQKVTDYGQGIAALIKERSRRSLDLFSLEDVFDSSDHEQLRSRLLAHYAVPVEVIKERVQHHDHHKALFNGVQRFLFEDRIGRELARSRTSLRNECKELAYQVIQRSDAWGRLIGECFPTALRLSIHPQASHSEKIGILLGESADNWLTPWHGVAVKMGSRFTLMHRHEAEALGARVIEREGRPSYYQIGE